MKSVKIPKDKTGASLDIINKIVLLMTNDRAIQARIYIIRRESEPNQQASIIPCMLQARISKNQQETADTTPAVTRGNEGIQPISNVDSSAHRSQEKQQAAQKNTGIKDKNSTDSKDVENTFETNLDGA